MKLVLITTAIFSLSQAHHHKGRGRSTLTLVGRHDKLHELIEKLEANPPKCKNNETICEEPVNEYPRELVELLMGDIHIPEEMFNSVYFDNRAKYFRWLNDQYQSSSQSQEIPCRTQLVEVYLPKVAHNFEGEPLYIVQREPYDIKKISYLKCLDIDKPECGEDNFFTSVLTLDQSGDIKVTAIANPFGCLWSRITGPGEDNRTEIFQD